MKIDLLEPLEQNASTITREKKISGLLQRQGYEVAECDCGPALFEQIRKDHPDVVFNLSSIYGWEKTNLVPAVLEIAGVAYTGSGMLGLSLARNYSKLFPLLAAAGIPTPRFQALAPGVPVQPESWRYPLHLYRDGARCALALQNRAELDSILGALPDDEEMLLMEAPAGERLSLYLLDGKPFLPAPASPGLELAQRAYRLLEARGLAGFHFSQGDELRLTGVDIAPDPLDEAIQRQAASAGLDVAGLLRTLVAHAGRDLVDIEMEVSSQ